MENLLILLENILIHDVLSNFSLQLGEYSEKKDIYFGYHVIIADK